MKPPLRKIIFRNATAADVASTVVDRIFITEKIIYSIKRNSCSLRSPIVFSCRLATGLNLRLKIPIP